MMNVYNRLAGFSVLGVILLLSFVLSFALLLNTASAQEKDEEDTQKKGQEVSGEIHYGSVKESKGNTVLLEYKGPWGVSYFVCDITSEESCKEYGETAPHLSAQLAGLSDFPKNAQGTLGVREYVLSPALAFYMLYDLSKDTPVSLGRLPVTTVQTMVKFTEDGKHILFIDASGLSRVYNVDTQTTTNPVALGERSYFTLSPKGTYASTYNWVGKTHTVWNLQTGAKSTILSGRESYLEFSDDEQTVAFLGDVGGYRTLFTSSIDGSNKVQVTGANTEVEDYLFVRNTLYYMANPTNPLSWSLFAFDGKESVLVSEDASYGDYIKQVGNSLAFIKTNGKNAEVTIATPGESDLVTLAPVPSSPLSANVNRKSVYVGERYGALLTPEDADDADTLYVWLHGGPMRQTSVGFHSYLSYAVYDELLENIAEAGNLVLKLDYSGSTGYGKAFQESLYKKIGTIDVDDVNRAVDEIKKEYKVKNVYVIGNSYGGYLALKTLADDPKKYKGAISINGVTDWYGLISRIPSSPFTKIFEGIPDLHNLDSYLAANVFTGLDNATKNNKVLVVYAENDDQVPTWQSEQYVDYAQTKSIDLEKVTLPGEQHVIRRRESLDKLCGAIKDFIGVGGLVCKP